MTETETIISGNTKLKMRFKCKRKDCKGKLEGSPEEITANKAYKFTISCPECGAEFSGGRRLIVQQDQVKGLCDVFKIFMFGNNTFDFSIYEEAEKCVITPATETKVEETVAPKESSNIDWGKMGSSAALNPIETEQAKLASLLMN